MAGFEKLTTDCVEHTYAGDKDGYASVRFGGKKVRLHRHVYCTANGVAPEAIEDQVIRHTCDNPRCINPAHLVAGTNTDNVQDRVLRGRSHKPIGILHPRSKLTEADIMAIREAYKKPGVRYKHLAVQYGITEKAVGNIVNKVTWEHVT